MAAFLFFIYRGRWEFEFSYLGYQVNVKPYGLLSFADAPQDGQTKAEQHKNMLLEFDRTSEQRTKVIDDESDYFSMQNDQWLTPQQRKALQKRAEEINNKRHGSRLDKKFTLDFAGLSSLYFLYTQP